MLPFHLQDELHPAEVIADELMQTAFIEEPGVPGKGSHEWDAVRRQMARHFLWIAEAYGDPSGGGPDREQVRRFLATLNLDREMGWPGLRAMLLGG